MEDNIHDKTYFDLFILIVYFVECLKKIKETLLKDKTIKLVGKKQNYVYGIVSKIVLLNPIRIFLNACIFTV